MNRPRKKNVIPDSRLRQLGGDVVYEIRCGVPGCTCSTPNVACSRGFFSLFIQAINGIAFAKGFHLRWYVNYGHVSYAYSQPGNPDRNFWNYYFDQPIRDGNSLNLLPNDVIETYPLMIWDRDFIRNLGEVMKQELVYKDEVKASFEALKTKFKGHKVLGVHIRRTDHAIETEPVEVDEYISEINKRISRFDKIFLATDDQAVAAKFKELYGDKLWLNDVSRSNDGQAVHENETMTNKYQLGLDALADCYALSLSDESLLYHSNLSYAALLFNPELKYKLMERASTKRKRLLTLSLYYLDKWNIRKW
ncbi:MAG: hypothetical protein WDO14_19930 [Bacteroidota bacterium]